jgi:hypothetical protein
MEKLTVTSAAFAEGAAIAVKHTCEDEVVEARNCFDSSGQGTIVQSQSIASAYALLQADIFQHRVIYLEFDLICQAVTGFRKGMLLQAGCRTKEGEDELNA